MCEVSRLLIDSAGLRPMETFFLISLSSLIGFDAPYLLFFILIFHHYLLAGYHSVMQTLGHSSRLSSISSS